MTNLAILFINYMSALTQRMARCHTPYRTSSHSHNQQLRSTHNVMQIAGRWLRLQR